ncbi:exonuclease II Exo2 [Coemansia sp. Benny D115]|nr:exonuclease II Exo2 [Coemansia sp. Benny D115]
MGIPKFFRWLTGRYPLVCERVADDNIPEFDNLYLDMNGIIHNCTHPKDNEIPAPATDEERFLAIFYYIDFLFNKIRPQKVFFLGIDGVAPRAKMNEQRARRFRTAKELEELQAKELRERRARGEVITQEDEQTSSHFDPTCITPGTEFMDKLTEALRYYINKRVSEDANWRKPKIILSAPNVPGEGEHKIMDYIRFSRAQPGYRPNTRHCLYGLDADLIMLGLLSHEPHFSLLREEVLFGASARKSNSAADPAMQSFYLLHISILRDYLDHEFGGLKEQLGCSSQYKTMEKGIVAGPQSNSAGDEDAYDLERIIDDYVLMSMLVGNDFLPTLPKLSINGGALNFMFATYIRIRPTFGGYLHDNGVLNLERFEVFMRELARVEVDSFKLEVADHQWYQVYKRKAIMRGETPDELSVTVDAKPNGRSRKGRSHRRDHDRQEFMSEGEMFDSSDVLGEATIPIKGSKLVISKSQSAMLDLIRKFAVRALPKVAASSSKVQMQFLPGPATPLDNLIVTKAAELLELHVGHEYAHNGSMTLYVAAGSPKAIAKLELEDNDSTGEDSTASSTVNFVGSSTSYSLLGALEDMSDAEDQSEQNVVKATKSSVPAFVEQVGNIEDEEAVAAYVDECLSELDDVEVVPDSELDNYTRKGDSSDFWQRFELWKANYYRTKVETTYDIPQITDDDVSTEGALVSSTGQVFRAPPSQIEDMCSTYIKTIQWVLMYYFHGCQSWSWFYPYHYAPSISDVCANLSAYKVDKFVNDDPYTPYEQLMCVLPPFSRKLLPSVLRSLMVDIHSPIRDQYPTSFDVDMNGKRMPWEAVVLINFVDINRIREAMKPKIAQLSEDETRRNSRGKNMIYSYAPLSVEEDAADLPEYQAPKNINLPTIRPLKCKGLLYIMPSLKSKDGRTTLNLVRGLIEGSATRASMRAGFPSLFTAAHTAKLDYNSTEVFGSPSRDESLIVTMLPNQLCQMGTTAEIAQILTTGKKVRGLYRPRRLFVSWPYLRDSVIVGVSDEQGVYTINSNGTRVVFHEYSSAGERQIWFKKYMDAVYNAKRMQAIVLNETPRVLVHVLHLRGLHLYPDGSLVRNYGFQANQHGDPSKPWAHVGSWSELGVESYHIDMVSSDLTGAWVNNPRYAEHEALPLERSLPVKDRVFFIGRTPLYGHPGKIVGHSYNEAGVTVGVDVQLVASVNPGFSKHENYLGVNTLAHGHQAKGDRYRPSFIVARDVNMSPLLLSRITSKMMLIDDCSSGSASRIMIGLDLKFEAKRLKAAGYTRRSANGWQYSDQAVQLIADYMSTFPEMIAYLESVQGSDIPTASECLAPRAADNAELTPASIKSHVSREIMRIKQWRKVNIENKISLIPIESELLSKDQISAISDASARAHPGATKKVLVRGVHREGVLRPVDAQYLLKGQSLMVGHRVIYVSDRGGSVPLGAKGYIVGIHAKSSQNPIPYVINNQHVAKTQQDGVPADMIHMVEVLFDKTFIDGTSLEGRCPPYRGALVPPHHVLNLTSWGVGHNVTNAPSANPRTVNVIRPTPDTIARKRDPKAGQPAQMAAKARQTMTRPSAVSEFGVESSGAPSVNVPEPIRAPWANANDNDNAKPKPKPVAAHTLRQAAPAAVSDNSHAIKIMSQLKSKMASARQPPANAPAAIQPTSDQTRAQNIISALLAGPMANLSINGNSAAAPAGAPAGARAGPSTSIDTRQVTGTALAAHPPVAGNVPIVIEDEYFSDSMDEDEDAGSTSYKPVTRPAQQNVSYNQVYFDYSQSNQGTRGGRGGRGGGYSARGHGTQRGRGRGGFVPGRGNGRGRGRGRGGFTAGVGYQASNKGNNANGSA